MGYREELPIAQSTRLRPRFDSGRAYWRAGIDQRLRVGTRFAHFPLPDSISGIEIAGLLSLCDGRREVSEIADAANSEPALVKDILRSLVSLGVLELVSVDSNLAALKDSDRGASSISRKNFAERFAIEAAACTTAVSDCSDQILRNRPGYRIEVIGSGRIATLLSANLIATGFSNTSLVNNRHPTHPSHRVRPSDICGAQFSEGDIGQMKSRIFDEIHERARLFPKEVMEGSIQKRSDLAIIVGSPTPDTQQALLSQGIPHLLVDFTSSDQVRIGPFVPRQGDAPCINCIGLSEQELGAPPIETLDHDLEVGAGLAMASAGLVSLEVTRIAEANESELTGRTLLLTSHRLYEPLLTIWQRHPACGCNWL